MGGPLGPTPDLRGLKLAPKRCPKFPVPLYIGTYSVGLIKGQRRIEDPALSFWIAARRLIAAIG